MPGPSEADKKVYEALRRPEFFPDEFKTWLPRFLRYLSALQVTKQQLPGVMGENWINVGDVGAPTFATGWRHYQGGATAYGKCRFYKDYMGIVHLEGLLDTTGTPSSPTIFNLPAGYRPSQQLLLITRSSVAATPASRVDITATGDVQVGNEPPYTSYTAGTWLSLSNIHFRAG